MDFRGLGYWDGSRWNDGYVKYQKIDMKWPKGFGVAEPLDMAGSKSADTPIKISQGSGMYLLKWYDFILSSIKKMP